MSLILPVPPATSIHLRQRLVIAVSIVGVEGLGASAAATIIDEIGSKALQRLAGL